MSGPRALLSSVVLTAWLALSCHGPQPRTAPESAHGHKVILISLDGAAAADLERLQASGAFEGGLARLFAAGESARYSLPVSPAATSVNHASMASGYPPSRTGIVSNAFHVAGQPIGERATGLATPSETENLWAAARRQGKRVGVVAFPGADPAGPRGDWGIDWMRPLSRPETVTVHAGDWRPLTEPTRTGGRRSYSPALAARLVAGATGGVGVCEAVAVDTSDDHRVNYDELLLPCGDPSGRTLPNLRVGQWLALRVEIAIAGAEPSPSAYGPEPPVQAMAWCKLLGLEPATGEARIYLGPASAAGGYPARYAGNLRRAGLRWPGPPDDRLTAAAWRGDPGIDPETWFEQSQRLTRFLIDAMIAGLADGDTDLVMGYLPAIDQAGHLLLLEDRRQALYSDARRASLAQMRDRVWRMVDVELGRLLDAADLRSTTVFVVSDHGMQAVHTALDLNAAFERAGLLAFETPERIDPSRTRVWAIGYGGIAHVYFNLIGREPAGIVTAAEVPSLEERVRGLLRGFSATAS
ncbi:MAG TPA: alkaline phosphatase family protein, partial [Vicinamibacterales bacterium]|nr:alkaline phosphatase family protein [Vicinamibacterales bacterium]